MEIVTKIASDYHLSHPGARPVPLVVIEVRDTGKGFPAEDLDRIFTPFYTTKIRGSGLGLAICQKIASDHQGFIKVESQPGEGTRFSVFLPLHR